MGNSFLLLLDAKFQKMIELKPLFQKIDERFLCETVFSQRDIMLLKIKSQEQGETHTAFLEGFDFISVFILAGNLTVTDGKEIASLNVKELFFSTTSIQVTWSENFEGHLLCAGFQAIEDLKKIFNPNTLTLFEKHILFYNQNLNAYFEHYLSDLELIKHLSSNHNSNGFGSRNLILHLQNFIFSLINAYNYSQLLEQRTAFYFSKFIDALNEYESSTFNIQFFADLLGISPKYLSIITQNLCKKSPLKIRDELLITKIKRMLSETDLSMQEMAVLFGFDSQSNFARFFKKESGLTPTEYKSLNGKA
jgi:AraC-type DNA-binding domain-containing proteins